MFGIALKILIAKKYAKSRDNIITYFKNNIIIIIIIMYSDLFFPVIMRMFLMFPKMFLQNITR